MTMIIKNITIVGAGVMGRGIAYVSALAGYQTTLVDVSEKQLKAAYDHAVQTTEKGIKKGKITESQAKQMLTNLNTSLEFEKSAKNADLIIEAVPEKQELKKMMMEAAESYAPEHTIFA